MVIIMAMMDDLITYHQPSKESKEPCAIAAAEGCLVAIANHPSHKSHNHQPIMI